MKIVGICGSPHKRGNCEKVMNNALSWAEDKGIDTERVLLAETKILHCIACDKCKKEKRCSQKDDFNSLIPLLEKADAWLLVSPVYMGGMSGLMKNFLDRSVLFRRQGFLLKNKLGAAIAIGGSRNGGQELAIMAMHSALHIQGMVPIGDNNHFGGTLQVPAMDDEFGMKTVKDTVEKLCMFLKRK